MGRHAALTPDQVAEAERRHFMQRESIRSIARDFGVDEAGLRRKLNPQKSALRTLAEDKVRAAAAVKAVDKQIEALPPQHQQLVTDLARAMVNTSSHLATASELSAETAAIMARLANTEARKIDVSPMADPQKNSDALKSALILQAGSNEASKIGLNLLSATKDQMRAAENLAPAGLGHFYGSDDEPSDAEPGA